MPTKKTWLLQLITICEELTAMDVPVIDRAVFERLFGVRRRRAIQLMHFFGGYQAGRTFLLDRLALLRQLEPLEASAEFALEQRRRATPGRIAGRSPAIAGRRACQHPREADAQSDSAPRLRVFESGDAMGGI